MTKNHIDSFDVMAFAWILSVAFLGDIEGVFSFKVFLFHMALYSSAEWVMYFGQRQWL